MSTRDPQKKLILIKGKKGNSGVKFDDKGEDSVIEVSFNPTEYSLDKTNVYSEAAIPGLGSPIIQFNRGNIRTLSLELLLDAYSNGKGGNLFKKKYIDKLEKLVNLDGELHAPPPCKVLWGNLEFIGVLESLKKRYILFSEDGKPVRARVTLSFKEYKPVEIQVKGSPTSSPDRTKRYLVKEGDSLWQISDEAYGEPGYWRFIADANNIENPRFLEIGKEIVIPPLSEK